MSCKPRASEFQKEIQNLAGKYPDRIRPAIINCSWNVPGM
jgi:hypothetical protein